MAIDDIVIEAPQGTPIPTLDNIRMMRIKDVARQYTLCLAGTPVYIELNRKKTRFEWNGADYNARFSEKTATGTMLDALEQLCQLYNPETKRFRF